VRLILSHDSSITPISTPLESKEEANASRMRVERASNARQKATNDDEKRKERAARDGGTLGLKL